MSDHGINDACEDEDDGTLLTQPALRSPHGMSEDADAAQQSASESSDVDESSAASSTPPSPTLAERRAQNIQRNVDLLERLGLQHGIAPRKLQPKRKRVIVDEESTDATSIRLKGMILPTRTSANKLNTETIYLKYPHREPQLRRLLGCILAAASHPTEYVPSPIICHGPAGTGKTAILLDILKLLPNYRTAYVNCATFEQVGNAELLMLHISNQLRNKPCPHLHDNLTLQKLSRATNQTDETEQMEELGTKGSRRSRSATYAPTMSVLKGSAKQYTTYSLQAEMSSLAESADAPLCAVWNFGRELKEQLSMDTCLILVLDNAELIPATVRNNKNLLAQLLLLPQVFELNLTIVLITNTYLLHETRMDNLAAASLSLATLSGDVHPIVIRFSAYRPKQLKTILKRPLIQLSIVEQCKDPIECCSGFSFVKHLYDSFLDMVIQTLHGRTANVCEVIQLARSMWPAFTLPLTSKYFEKTVATIKSATLAKAKASCAVVDSASADREFASFLNKKIRPLLRDLEATGFGSLSNITTSCDASQQWPDLVRYLMLAAYLCQVNHADKDKQLFSIRKNRQRRPNDANHDEQEELAFGSTAEKNSSRYIRPHSFPLERVLSVFVCIVGLRRLNKDENDTLGNLGDVFFNDMFSTLREAGVLLEQCTPSASDAISLTAPRYHTTISDDDAKSLARAMNFPLDQFTL
ncbi:hypothetical protein MPSEU_000469600 [Mayamaea pseudoterrestris]|nr:hypothetical protein MPSEU_000469600 [Mayamaea pseudoterrestris]